MAKSKSKPIRARRKSEYDGDEGSEQHHSTRWWKCEDGTSAASALWTWVDRLRPQLVADNFMDLIYEAIYKGRPLTSAGAARNIESLRTSRIAAASFNIARSMVDTATARLTKRRPMPVVSANNAGWGEKQFAKSTSRVLRTKIGGSKVERLSPDIIRDMIVRGDGVAKIIRNGGDVDIDRIPVFEIIYDPAEAYYATPTSPVRTLAHHRPVSRDVLCEEYPEYEEEIEKAVTFRRMDPWSQYAYGGISFADYVEVVESWHLPSGPRADDGQHMLAIRGKTIYREPWTRPRYPIYRCHWSSPMSGFRGQGLVEDLTGMQSKINDILRDTQENLWWGSSLKVFAARGANVNKHHLRARNPIVVEYDGAAPQYVAPNPVSEQAIKVLVLLFDKAYEISGISQMSASSKSTLGSNASGKALDTMEDIQSDRFAQVESGYMQFRVELGQGICDEARAMYDEATGKTEQIFDEQGEPLTKADLAPWIAEHDWGKVKIDEGDFHLTIEPINFLPDTRAGKLSFVAEMSKAGLIPDPTQTADLFDEPDIARMNRSSLGPKHNIDRALEGLSDPDIDMMELMPDLSWNLPLAVEMAKGERNDAQANKAPPDVLDRYDAFLQQCKTLMKLPELGGSASLPGMQATNMGASPNAMDMLPPGAAAGMPPSDPGGMPPDAAMMNPGIPPGAVMQ